QHRRRHQAAQVQVVQAVSAVRAAHPDPGDPDSGPGLSLKNQQKSKKAAGPYPSGRGPANFFSIQNSPKKLMWLTPRKTNRAISATSTPIRMSIWWTLRGKWS